MKYSEHYLFPWWLFHLYCRQKNSKYSTCSINMINHITIKLQLLTQIELERFNFYGKKETQEGSRVKNKAPHLRSSSQAIVNLKKTIVGSIIELRNECVFNFQVRMNWKHCCRRQWHQKHRHRHNSNDATPLCHSWFLDFRPQILKKKKK